MNLFWPLLTLTALVLAVVWMVWRLPRAMERASRKHWERGIPRLERTRVRRKTASQFQHITRALLSDDPDLFAKDRHGGKQ